MIGFLEKTWYLWWMAAMLVITRWFHVVSVAAAHFDTPDSNSYERPDHSDVVSGHLASRA